MDNNNLDYLPDGPPIISDTDLAHSRALEARIERHSRFDYIKYIIYGTWIPLVIYLTILIYL